MKRKPTILTLLMVLLVASVWPLATTALVQTGGPYDLSWSTIDEGGSSNTRDSYWLGGTAGQIDASGPLTGGSFDVGFKLYRAQSPTGNWVRLNAALIPRQSPSSVFGATYTWLDEDVASGITYYYKLEDVEVGGQRTFHGPITAQAGSPTAIILRALGIDTRPTAHCCSSGWSCASAGRRCCGKRGGGPRGSGPCRVAQR